jgi:hypothetical protein
LDFEDIMVSNGLARQNLVVGVSTALTAISGKMRRGELEMKELIMCGLC